MLRDMYTQQRMRTDSLGPWLVGGGLWGALSTPFLGGFGTLIGIGCAIALAIRGHRLPALAVAAVSVLAIFALLLFTGAIGLETGGEPERIYP